MINPLTWYVDAAQRWAWKGVTVLALACSLGAVGLVYARVPAQVGIALPETVHVVPATGEHGFPVEVFCEDDATEITVTVLQDVGESFEALRIKDGVPELVVWNTDETDNRLATYYFMEAGIQQSAVAVVNDDAAECMREKSQ